MLLADRMTCTTNRTFNVTDVGIDHLNSENSTLSDPGCEGLCSVDKLHQPPKNIDKNFQEVLFPLDKQVIKWAISWTIKS
jgi:hypothetical protein